MATGPYLVTRGIVLRDTDTRDADKILTACAQPLAYSEWTLHKKGQWYYANEGSTIELFNGLRSELDAMALGFYLAELTEGVITEESPQQELLSLLLNGLYAISTLHKPLPLVKAAFECRWRMPAPTAAGRSRSSPALTYCKGCFIAEAAENGAGSLFPCAGTRWPLCGTLFTATPSGCTPLRWGRMPRSGCPPLPRPSFPPSWSGGSKRWIFIRACAVWCRNRIQNVIYTTFNTFRSEHERII